MNATESLELGNGVTLDLVLIPAGRFIMGAPEQSMPSIYPEDGAAIIVLGGLLLFEFILFGIVYSRKKGARPQLSLLRYLMCILALSLLVYGGVYYYEANQAWIKYNRSQKHSSWEIAEQRPAHRVTLVRPFYMSRTELTVRQYEAVMGKRYEYSKPGETLDHPAIIPTWLEAIELWTFARAKTGRSVRLPLEAEWEFSCRAGTQTLYHSGDANRDLREVAWFADNSVRTGVNSGRPKPVATKKPNAFNLFDMHGNVSEWCIERFEPYKDRSIVVDAAVEVPRLLSINDYGTPRVIRGGNSNDWETDCQSGARKGSYGRGLIGVRLVVDVP
ncbi:MAG TPA: SUMF1/EgtB/PvdO family nonheme iron enzyme [Planctomycetota bacterium]|nr:SUMF1/EgtB/PvdO family nonheme iron enzyme [Planctomycetota bacterium]